MFLLRLSIWWILLALGLSACDLEIYEYDSREVLCSQGLSECIIEDVTIVEPVDDGVDIDNLEPYIKLCCNDSISWCTLCLIVDTEISINQDKGLKDENQSRHDEETQNPKASVTVCYQTVHVLPTCKKVEFMINSSFFSQKEHKVSMVITKLAGLSFNSDVMVYAPATNKKYPIKNVCAPSLNKVCRLNLQKRVQRCHVPRLKIAINNMTNKVELNFAQHNKPLPSMCIQYEKNGGCQRWNRTTIPLYSVAPCMCFQVWDEDRSVRSQRCPFINNSDFKMNILQNVSVSFTQRQGNNHSTVLLWNMSAPCRLEGEVWPCLNKNSCKKKGAVKQKLANGKWRQNCKGFWENNGVFEDTKLQLSPCVMVTIEGHELGPFCLNNTDRWHWNLLVVGVLLLICLTALIFYFLHVYIKKWVWSWHHSGFVKIVRKCHLVLLSPPDADDGVSEMICQLGSQLCNQGFDVSMDQYSRKEQCSLGPLLWLHSQLLKPNSRVVLVLTRKALEKVEEWANKQVIKGKEEEVPQMWSPYSDVFTASLCIIQAEKQLGRVQQRFLLVNFDSHLGSGRNLPKLLQGLPLFQLPSQSQSLLAELSVSGTERRSRKRTWIGWKMRL